MLKINQTYKNKLGYDVWIMRSFHTMAIGDVFEGEAVSLDGESYFFLFEADGRCLNPNEEENYENLDI